MKKEVKLYCYGKREFDRLVASGIDPDARYISICGNRELTDEGPELHSLDGNLENVLNLNFDDCSEEVTDEKGIKYFPLTENDAKKIYMFLEDSGNKDIYVHCLAGKSRSQGVVRFAQDTYPRRNYVTRPENPCETPNPEVVRKLNRILRLDSVAIFNDKAEEITIKRSEMILGTFEEAGYKSFDDWIRELNIMAGNVVIENTETWRRQKTLRNIYRISSILKIASLESKRKRLNDPLVVYSNIKTLRTKLEAVDKCSFCCSNDPETVAEYESSGKTWIKDGNILVSSWTTKDGEENIIEGPIRYCPMCGKELDVE